MTEPTEQEIKERAHDLWERAGKPEGRQDEFWYRAEQELRKVDPAKAAEPLRDEPAADFYPRAVLVVPPAKP